MKKARIEARNPFDLTKGYDHSRDHSIEKAGRGLRSIKKNTSESFISQMVMTTAETMVLRRQVETCCCQVASVVADSVRPPGLQPTRLLHPWDSPGKNTGVGCHFLLQCMKVESESESEVMSDS